MRTYFSFSYFGNYSWNDPEKKNNINAGIGKAVADAKTIRFFTGCGCAYDTESHQSYIIYNVEDNAKECSPADFYRMYPEFTPQEYTDHLKILFGGEKKLVYSEATETAFMALNTGRELSSYIDAIIEKGICNPFNNDDLDNAIGYINNVSDYKEICRKTKQAYLCAHEQFYLDSQDYCREITKCPKCKNYFYLGEDIDGWYQAYDTFVRLGDLCPTCGSKTSLNYYQEKYKIYFELLKNKNILAVVHEYNDGIPSLFSVCLISDKGIKYIYIRGNISVEESHVLIVNSFSDLRNIFENSNISELHIPEIYGFSEKNYQELAPLSQILSRSKMFTQIIQEKGKRFSANYLETFIANPEFVPIYLKNDPQVVKALMVYSATKKLDYCESQGLNNVSETLFKKTYNAFSDKDLIISSFCTCLSVLESAKDITDEDFFDIIKWFKHPNNSCYESYFNEIHDIAPELSPFKVLVYIINKSKTKHESIYCSEIIKAFKENLINAKLLGKNINDEKIVFPKNFSKQVKVNRKECKIQSEKCKE